MENRPIDYTNKNTWSVNNLPKIAEDLGYVPNQRFSDTLLTFIVETVEDARVTNFLLVIARSYFDKITPPLERINKQTLNNCF